MHAPVAQLDRASDFGSEGWGFESLQACYFIILSIFLTLVSSVISSLNKSSEKGAPKAFFTAFSKLRLSFSSKKFISLFRGRTLCEGKSTATIFSPA
jgi:hypothetical protein